MRLLFDNGTPAPLLVAESLFADLLGVGDVEQLAVQGRPHRGAALVGGQVVELAGVRAQVEELRLVADIVVLLPVAALDHEPTFQHALGVVLAEHRPFGAARAGLHLREAGAGQAGRNVDAGEVEQGGQHVDQ